MSYDNLVTTSDYFTDVVFDRLIFFSLVYETHNSVYACPMTFM